MNKYKKYIFASLLFLSFGFTPAFLFAAEPVNLYFKNNTKDLHPGVMVKLPLFLKTTEPVNTFDVRVKFSDSNLDFLSYSNTNSVVNIWKVQPKLFEPGLIALTGGITGGFSGSDGLLTELTFRVKSAGVTEITPVKTDVYLADGSGTKASVLTTALILNISENLGTTVKIEKEENLVVDSTAPNLFMHFVSGSSGIDPLIVFDAKDDESGIATTKIRFKKLFSYSDWVEVSNPALYQKGAWQVELFAENNAGLSTQKDLILKHVLFAKIILLFGVLLVLVLLFKTLYNTHKRKQI